MFIAPQDWLVPVPTVAPETITTESVEAGTTPPTHVDVELQLPVTAFDIIVAACADKTNREAKKSKLRFLRGKFSLVFITTIWQRYFH